MPRREPLGVWLYGIRIAELTTTGPGDVTLRYTEEALDRWRANVPLLSCSLPLRPKRQKAGFYFKGMLAEGQHLQALAAQARVPTYDTFGLLARFGRDVAGAAVIAADEPAARAGSVEPYGPGALAAEISDLPERPLAVYDDSELSIAGLQNKLLLVATGSGWARPVGGRPSTHILKVEDRRFPGLAEMEAACLRLARAVGLTDVDATVEEFDGVPSIIVSRFDRTTDSAGNVVRIHQEDACQALGRDPEAQRGRGKYEDAGGPRLREVAALLDVHAGTNAVAELSRLAAAVTFTVVIGNADAHGKNISLLHPEPGVVALAPLYDTVPTVLWPALRDRAAMSINSSTVLSRITVDDLVEEARRWTLDARRARAIVVETAAALAEAARDGDIPERLAALVSSRTVALLR